MVVEIGIWKPTEYMNYKRSTHSIQNLYRESVILWCEVKHKFLLFPRIWFTWLETFIFKLLTEMVPDILSVGIEEKKNSLRPHSE